MNEFDSDYSRLPHVPFIVELPTLCFKVHIPMCLAEQQEQLPYFELIQTPIKPEGKSKNIGHKCIDFFATCSVFILIGNGYTLFYEPYDWSYERKIDIKNNILSLDDAPAKEHEAWEIYSAYKYHKDNEKVEQMIEYLVTDQITPEHIKKHFPDFIKHYESSNRINKELIETFEKTVGNRTLIDRLINRKKKRVKISQINLLISYQSILSRQTHKNKANAIREAIHLFSPNLAQDSDEFGSMVESLRKKIDYHHLDGSEEIEFMFPDLSKSDPCSKIRHHFESNDDEYSLILEMIKNGVIK